jgi:nitrite reductase/ring-hydroxylating ferredoxin subunit
MSDWPEWPVCAESAVPDGGALEFEVGGGDWPFRGFLVRHAGALRAFANVCPHKRYPLNMVEHAFRVPGEALVRCAQHGALFDPDSGQCLAGPCAGRSLLRLEFRVAGGEVLVRAPATLSEGLAALAAG